MFWDKAASLYDFFEIIYNGKVYRNLGPAVADMLGEKDTVLECACGTGAITAAIAAKASKVVATDLSDGMMSQAKKKCKSYGNVHFETADIMKLDFADESFDAVVAGNVIHLLPDPQAAVRELMRVCKKGGKVIIPTYMNRTKSGRKRLIIRFLEALGAEFKGDFSVETYEDFLRNCVGLEPNIKLVEGRMTCAIAELTNSQ